jgi:DNA-directed RNA polymerase sigma subunit (sigma70/sigma32)
MNPSTLPFSTSTAPTAALDAVVAQFLSHSLSGPQAALLRLRFGLDGPPCSLAAAARRLGLRPAAALRLEHRAMRALRAAATAVPGGAPGD